MAKIYPNERSVGLFKCGKKRCEVCKCVNKIKNFTSSVTQKAFKVNHCFNYDISAQFTFWCVRNVSDQALI